MNDTLASKMEELKTDPLEYNRQTGRTFRMMEMVKAVSVQGQPVVVVFNNEQVAKHYRDKYPHLKGVTMIAMKIHMPELDWASMKFVTGPYAFHKTFIDHDVIYVYHKELFKAYHHYDRPMDQVPYLKHKEQAA